jgi:kumamolisin
VPDYQQTVSMPPNLNGGPGRGLPDVAAVADPQTPYAVFVDGSWTDVGGTSAVAPFFAGLLARINSLQSKRIGFINPHIFSGAGVGFNDITVGNNSTGGVVGYSAGTGWDAVTGFGSPNGAQLLEILSQPADGA